MNVQNNNTVMFLERDHNPYRIEYKVKIIKFLGKGEGFWKNSLYFHIEIVDDLDPNSPEKDIYRVVRGLHLKPIGQTNYFSDENECYSHWENIFMPEIA